TVSSAIHHLLAVVDPVTGKTRLIASTDSGLFTGVYDRNGLGLTSIGNAVTATGGRSGDLAVNEMVRGAVQSSVGSGLANDNAGTSLRDPQWPDYTTWNFAVNPVNPDQVVISSSQGRIYATINRGQTWFVVGEPTQSVLDGTYAPAMAFAAADPSSTGVGSDA